MEYSKRYRIWSSSSTRLSAFITANGVIEVPKVKVIGIGFKELYVEDVEVICHDILEIAEIEGLPGLNFLKYFRNSLTF